jgi:hypothetical protein
MVDVIRQRWEHLLFLHWTADAEEIRRLLPPGLEVDTFHGRAYAAVVPFDVPENRLAFLPPVPFTGAYHEVNARTYVRGPDGTPGVWVLSLDASSALVAQAARAAFHLPYHHAAMRFAVAEEEAPPPPRRWITFESRRRPGDPPECAVRYSPGGVPRPAAAGTLEHFLVERYVLFAWTGERLLSGRVRHRPYEIQGARVEGLQERLIRGAGLTPRGGEPLVHYAAGVTVDIAWPRAAGAAAAPAPGA